MKTRSLIAILIGALLLAACTATTSTNQLRGSGNVVTEERSLEQVDSVTLATLGDMTIVLGEPSSIIIEAEDNLLSSLETKVRSGTLTVQSKPGVNLQPTKPVRYTLTVPSLEALSSTSSGNIAAPALEGGAFTINTSSSGNISLDELTASRLDVEITSSGNVTIAVGQVTEQQINISSSGAYRAGDVRSDRAVAHLTSSGDATIWVTDTLDVSLSSSGNVNYYGSPVTTESSSSSGRLVSRGDK